MAKILNKLIGFFHKLKIGTVPEPTASQRVEMWFLNPEGLDKRGICLGLSTYISSRTPNAVRVSITDTFLERHYKSYSGYPMFPVPSPDNFFPGDTFVNTSNYLEGAYGELRMELFEVLKAHKPYVVYDRSLLHVAWIHEDEIKR